jgi:hypothetical protein
MEDWAERKAEKILDAFLAYEGPDDLLLLQQAIAAELNRAYEMGRNGKTPDTTLDPGSCPPDL